jgi:hypothetical protein
MTQQSAVTIAADVRPGEAVGLRELLASMGNGVANGSVLDLSSLSEVHFARLFLLEETVDLEGRPLPAMLVYLSDFDVSKDEHLVQLAAAPGLDRVFENCEGYPVSGLAQERLAYLRAHVVDEQARYVNRPGRTVRQIQDEAALREALQSFLDERKEDLAGRDALQVRAAILNFVRSTPSLAWALEPEPGPSLGWRLRKTAHFVAIALGLLLLLPLALLAAPIYAFLLWRRERSDTAEDLKPDEETVRVLAAVEDHAVQNPFTAIGFVKPGLFRRLTILGVLNGVSFAARHVFNRGSLAGVKTIHFARWVFLDEGRRVFFASNYDGSLESYMDDFIDQISWGLNIVFSNGYGYPKTRWLVLDGSRDELAFKNYLRRHQVPTFVWHTAYGRLTAANIARNEQIRAGLSGDMARDEAERWLRHL